MVRLYQLVWNPTHANLISSESISYKLLEDNMAIRYFNAQPKLPNGRRGKRIVKAFIREDSTDDACLTEVVQMAGYEHRQFGFTVNAGEHWLDLGANIGAFAIFCYLRGATCDCFEPDPANFRILSMNIQDRQKVYGSTHRSFWPGFTAAQTAVTHRMEEELPFFSGVGPRDFYRGSALVPITQRRVQKLPNMHASVLRDGYWSGDPGLCISVDPESPLVTEPVPYAGVKMDIEGSEFGLIENDLIPACQKLVMEYHFSHDRSMVNFRKRIKILKKRFKSIYYIPSLDQEYPNDEFPEKFDRYIWCKDPR